MTLSELSKRLFLVASLRLPTLVMADDIDMF